MALEKSRVGSAFFCDRKHSLGEEAKLSGLCSWACRELQSGFLPDSTSLRESGAQRPSEKEKHPSSVPYFFSQGALFYPSSVLMPHSQGRLVAGGPE